jgi:hypothetical protein
MGARDAWLAGALTIFAVVPFTVIAIMPTNNQLLDRTSEAANRLLERWGKLHGVRSILGLAASIAFYRLSKADPFGLLQGVVSIQLWNQ